MTTIRHLRVSRWQRDGKKITTPKPPEQTLEMREVAKRGRKAEQAGEPRWVNPYVYTKARQWTYAWNLSHCERNGGACEGCTQCVVGCEPPNPSFKQWLRDFEQRDQSYVQLRRHVQGGGGTRHEKVEAGVGNTETV